MQLTANERHQIYIMSNLKDNPNTATYYKGLEFAEYERIEKGLETGVYFAHSYCSWERGTNENTSGFIRQYLPKGMDFNMMTDEKIRFVMDRLNNRPRATRGESFT